MFQDSHHAPATVELNNAHSSNQNPEPMIQDDIPDNGNIHTPCSFNEFKTISSFKVL